jgi:hypothetical protein
MREMTEAGGSVTCYRFATNLSWPQLSYAQSRRATRLRFTLVYQLEFCRVALPEFS